MFTSGSTRNGRPSAAPCVPEVLQTKICLTDMWLFTTSWDREDPFAIYASELQSSINLCEINTYPFLRFTITCTFFFFAVKLSGTIENLTNITRKITRDRNRSGILTLCIFKKTVERGKMNSKFSAAISTFWQSSYH